MNITLELWDDQCTITDKTESSLWVMKLNGLEFPEGKNSLMTLDIAHKIVNKLMEIEEIAYNDELS
jgi:hypothetical protein